MLFSFIDFGLKDFCRSGDGTPIRLEFDSYDEASEFIADGKLEELADWTNEGTKIFCWGDEET